MDNFFFYIQQQYNQFNWAVDQNMISTNWRNVALMFIDDDKADKSIQNQVLQLRSQGKLAIAIYQWEWELKTEKIKRLIEKLLDVNQKTVYGRQCVIRNVDREIYRRFLELYHLNGSVNSMIRKGLYYNNKLIAVFGYGNSRFAKNEYELHRYCVKTRYKIVGGFNKLIKNCKLHNCYSYIDIAHFTGEGYFKTNWKQVKITRTNYVYRRDDLVLSRYDCQKHRQPLFLEKFDINQTEWMNMLNNGYKRIFDCGNIKVHY